MKKIVQLSLALVSALFYFSGFAAIIHQDHHHDDPTTFLGPTLLARFTSPINHYSAFSLLGEAGRKNFRVNGTVGIRSELNQRLKLSAEWLRQEITYSFLTGHSDQWLNQWAIGLGYQYDFPCDLFDPAFDFSAYYSHAPNKSLGTRTGEFTDRFGNPFTFANVRHIAGSNAGGVAPGVSISPWIGGRAGLALNYDNVHYDTRYADHKVIGFGGTAYLDTALTDHVAVGASAGFRQPFNNYTAYVGWGNVPCFGGLWFFNIDGAYTKGKERLPNTWNLGISFDFRFEPCRAPIPVNLKDDYKHEAVRTPCGDTLSPWVADPAVYMPQVLAIAEERLATAPIPLPPPPVVCIDGIPAVIGTIPNPPSFPSGPHQIATAQVFTGSNLNFSVIATPTNPANTVTIDPATGVVTVTNNGGVNDSFPITVIATNSCGSASTSFTVFLID